MKKRRAEPKIVRPDDIDPHHDVQQAGASGIALQPENVEVEDGLS